MFPPYVTLCDETKIAVRLWLPPDEVTESLILIRNHEVTESLILIGNH